MPNCISFADDDCHGEAVDLVGGKNASLGTLSEAGVRVPPGFAVTTEFYERFLESTDLEGLIYGELNEIEATNTKDRERASQEIREAIKSESFPPELNEDLEGSWKRLKERSEGDDSKVAVRSSATAEDLPSASFAGQQETYLNVSGLDNVKRRVRDCMASLFTPRAISYREEHGFDHESVLISVGVQKMVDARSSGVMFTLNPANGDRSKVRIESNWGLGESVVSGEVTPDSFLVDKPVGTIVEQNISTKRVMTTQTDSEVETVEVPEEKQDEASLSSSEIERLTDRARKIEKQYGEPQDIEWAIEEHNDGESTIYILQSRPETTWNDEDTGTTGSSKRSDGSTSAVDSMLDVLSS